MPVSDLTDEEKRTLKGAIRRAFRQSDRPKGVLAAARVELPPALKKDGTPGKKNQVRFRCASCQELFPGKWIQVDHIEPVVPLNRKEMDMTPNELVDGVFSSPSNLQVICSTPIKFLPKGVKSCHAVKTVRENFIRKGIVEHGGNILGWSLKYEEHLAEKARIQAEKDERKRLKQEKKKCKELKKAKNSAF